MPDTTPSTTAATGDDAAPSPLFNLPSAAQLNELSQQKKAQQHFRQNTPCNHDQRPGPAPRGSRRSMGKR